MSSQDWSTFNKCRKRFGTRRNKNLHSWASANMRKGSFMMVSMNKEETLREESWEIFEKRDFLCFLWKNMPFLD